MHDGIEIVPSGIILGGGPRCWGMVLFDERRKRTDRIECAQPATWRKIIDHCGRRERFLCDEHREIDLQIRSLCRACGSPIVTGWEEM